MNLTHLIMFGFWTGASETAASAAIIGQRHYVRGSDGQRREIRGSDGQRRKVKGE